VPLYKKSSVPIPEKSNLKFLLVLEGFEMIDIGKVLHFLLGRF